MEFRLKEDILMEAARWYSSINILSLNVFLKQLMRTLSYV